MLENVYEAPVHELLLIQSQTVESTPRYLCSSLIAVSLFTAINVVLGKTAGVCCVNG